MEKICKLKEAERKAIIDTVNEMIDWELPINAMGAFNVWEDEGILIVDVETSDGGVSAIEYYLFLEEAEKNEGKVTQEAFCRCYH